MHRRPWYSIRVSGFSCRCASRLGLPSKWLDRITAPTKGLKVQNVACSLRFFWAVAAGILTSLSAAAQTTWSSADLGLRTPVGKTLVTDSGYDLTSATGDVWGYSDNARFLYQSVSGDFDFRVRLESFLGIAYWAKAGAMVRANLTPNSINGFAVATRESGWGRYMFTARLADTYSSAVYLQGSFVRANYPAVWVRLVRIGYTLYPMSSTDGLVWEQMGSQLVTLLPRTALVGMAVSNHPESGTIPATAQFRDINLLPGAPLAPVVMTQPTPIKANPGDSATLTVTAAGKGPLAYQWHRDGIPLAEGGTLPTLLLTSLDAGKAGKYMCRISNSEGVVWSWASQVELVPEKQPVDGIRFERFDHTYGSLVAYLINATNFPATPAASSIRTTFEAPSFGDDTGGRIKGFLTPPVTGSYTFYIAADNSGRLLLSTDDNPANVRIIAECPFWVNARQWDYYNAQESIPIRLQAGRRYYIEAIFKGEGSPNHCAVGWRLPDGQLERPIPGSRFLAGMASLQLNSNGTVHVEGTQNSIYVLETSGNLQEWTPMETNRVPFDYRAFMEAIPSTEFYRAKTLP